MSQMQKFLNSPRLRNLEWLGFGLIALVWVLRFWHSFLLTPDAGPYLTAAMNFVKHGKFFIYMNWPIRTMLPSLQLYADFPPGYPTYLSLFLVFIRDPLLGAGIAQVVALVALCFVIYRAATMLGMSAPFKLALLLFLGSFGPHRVTLQALLTEPLYLTFCFSAALSSFALTRKGDSRGRWAWAFFSLFCAAGTRWNGFACVAFFLVPLAVHRVHVFRKLCLVGAGGALPICLWFLRNYLSIGSASSFYGWPGLILEKIPVPFVASVVWWGMGSAVVAALVFLAALTPFFVKPLRAIADLPLFSIVWVGAIGQFLVIYVLSLVMMGMTPVDDRYLMPSYFFFSLALFYSAELAVRAFRLEKIALAAAVLVLLAGLAFKGEKLKTFVGNMGFTRGRPVEEALWQELLARPVFQEATHYYSSQNYRHQMFYHRPQLVIWPERPSDQQLMDWAMEPRAFMILEADSAFLPRMEKLESQLPQLHKEVNRGFTIYYK